VGIDVCQVARCSGIGLNSARMLATLKHERKLTEYVATQMINLLNSIEIGGIIIKERRISEEVPEILCQYQLVSQVLLDIGFGKEREHKVKEYLSCISSLQNNQELPDEQKRDFEGFLERLCEGCKIEHEFLLGKRPSSYTPRFY